MRKNAEPSRIREEGTEVTNPEQSTKPGLARIAAIRKIVEKKQYAKVDGCMVDLFTASAIVAVYDAINPDNQSVYRNCKAGHMGIIAFRLTK